MSTTTTLALGRNLVGQFARSAGDPTTYPDAYKDRAIRMVCDDLIRHTNATSTLSTVTLTADSATLDLSTLTTFTTDRAIRLYLAHPTDATKEYDVTLTDAAQVRQARRDDPRATTPSMAALLTDAAGLLWPTPDVAYVAHLEWKAPLTTFTLGTQGAWSSTTAYYPQDIVASGGILYRAIVPGTNKTPASNATYWTSLGSGTLTGPDSVTLNIRDDYLEMSLTYGATAMLQHTDPKALYADASYQRYLAFRNEIAGRAGSRSVKSFSRTG